MKKMTWKEMDDAEDMADVWNEMLKLHGQEPDVTESVPNSL